MTAQIAAEPKPADRVATAEPRDIRVLPLQFWLGPLLLLSLKLKVVGEPFLPRPDAPAAPPPPDLASLPPGVRGLCRRGQPLPPDAAPATVPGWMAYVLARYDQRLILLRQDFDAYIRHFSRKGRIRVKGEVRRFAEASGGSVRWQVYKTPEEIAAFYRLARDVSQHTYQEKLFNKGLPSGPPALPRFMRLAEADEMRGYILFWGDLPISYISLPGSGDRLVLGNLGYRPEFARHSPGTVLMYLAVEQLIAERRFELLDLGEGGEGLHKRAFATHSVPCANILYLPRTPANVAMLAGHRAWGRLSGSLVGLVERIGMRQRLRRWFRGGSKSDATEADSAASSAS